MYDFRACTRTRCLAEERQSIAGNAQPAAPSDGTIVVWGDARVVRARIQAEAASQSPRLAELRRGRSPVATAAQERLIAAAGQRAAEQVVRQISSAESAVRVAVK